MKKKNAGMVCLAIGILSVIGGLGSGSFVNFLNDFNGSYLISIFLELGLIIGGIILIVNGNNDMKKVADNKRGFPQSIHFFSCPNCGNANPAGMQFCQYCGGALIQQMQPQNQQYYYTGVPANGYGQNGNNKKKLSVAAIVGICVAAVVVMVLTGCMLVSVGNTYTQKSNLKKEIGMLQTILSSYKEEEPEIVSDKMDMYLERNVCSGQYADVEDSLKEYVKDGEQCLKEVFLAKKELLDFCERVDLGGEAVYISDYIDELNRFRSKLADAIEKLKDLSQNNTIMSYVDNKSLDSSYVRLYQYYALNTGEKYVTYIPFKEVEASFESVLLVLDQDIELLRYLDEHQGSWMKNEEGFYFIREKIYVEWEEMAESFLAVFENSDNTWLDDSEVMYLPTYTFVEEGMDAAAYIRAYLDIYYRNDFDEAKKLRLWKEEDARELYENEISSMVDALVGNDNVSESVKEGLADTFRSMSAKVRYTVTEAEKIDDESYQVTIECEQLQTFGTAYPSWMAEIETLYEEISLMTESEMADFMYSALKKQIDKTLENPVYKEKESIKIMLVLEAEEWCFEGGGFDDLEMKLIDYEAL